MSVRKRGPTYDLAEIGRLLALDEPPDAGRQRSPSIWVDGRLHHEATRWLETRYARWRNDATVETNAARLTAWVGFLRERGQTVHTASEDDYRVYEATKRFPADGSSGVTDGWWSTTKSTIKQFHEWLHATHGTPLPFPLVDKSRPDGSRIRGIADAGRLRTSTTDVLPLLPDAVEALVRAVQRPTPRGHERRNRYRDRALVEWLVATGMRVTAATLMTVHELPARTGGDFDLLRVPGAIAKYRRAVHRAVFAHRLGAVRAYVNGERRHVVDGAPAYRPARPLRVVHADAIHVVFADADGCEHAPRRWDDVTSEQRLRLVGEDDRSPLLFLDQTGKPMTARNVQKIVKAGAAHAAGSNDHFPAGVHPHSLRHTYATFMVVMWLTRDDDLYQAEDPHRIRFSSLIDAVRHVQREMGHTSEATTHIYTRHVKMLLGLDADRVKGKR